MAGPGGRGRADPLRPDRRHQRRHGGNDGRVGSSALMAIVAKVGKETSVSGLYDLQGKAAAILAAAS